MSGGLNEIFLDENSGLAASLLRFEAIGHGEQKLFPGGSHREAHFRGGAVAEDKVKVQLFRERAAELRQRAETATSDQGRDTYLKLAEMWAKLADSIHDPASDGTKTLRT